MNDLEILQSLKDVLNEMMPDADLSGVTADTRLGDDLGIDSLKMLQLAILTEDALKVRFFGRVKFETVGDVIAYIQRSMKN